MAISDERLNALATVCGLAQCTDREVRAVILQATGHTEKQVGETLEPPCSQPHAHRILKAAKEKLLDWQARWEREDMRECRELWHMVQQEVEELPGLWRPASIAKSAGPERPTDDLGRPILPPVKVFAPEDLAEEHTRQVVGVLTPAGDMMYNGG